MTNRPTINKGFIKNIHKFKIRSIKKYNKLQC